MKIVIAGGSGFLGGHLADALARDGDDVVVLTRGHSRASGPVRSVTWIPDDSAGAWAAELDGAGAVVNLAGESIAARRWSAAHKQHILDSRIHSTRSLVVAINKARQRPPAFVSGSAVGYYGPLGDELATEEREAGRDFLATVCRQWEAEAMRSASTTRTVCIRTGLVLDREGGALPKMLPPFKLGAGGPVGSGKQYWPWIHRQDWVDLVRWIIRSPSVAGPVNLTAPSPVPNSTFARALGRALHRPALIPTPAFALKLLLGEMADALLLSGQRAVPAKAERLGYKFGFARIDEALAALFT
jgi:uncharacterized protein (TIGR01777 family)